MTLASILALAATASSGFVDRGSYSLHYESMGSGPPSVAIPGGPGFAGRAVWSYGYEMRDVSQVILFSQLGTGLSRMKDGSAPNLSLRSTIADLEALRKHLGFKKWTVFGQSWGAIVAVAYAAEHPDRVDRLVLASIPGFRDRDYQVLSTNLMARAGTEIMFEITQQARQAKTAAESAAIQVFSLTPYYFFDSDLGSDLLKRARPELFDGNTFIDLYQDVNDHNFAWIRAGVAKWKGRALIIQGHQDPCGAAMAYELGSFLPNSTIYMMDGAGHFTFIEKPHVFFTETRKFLGLKAPPHYRYFSGPQIDQWRIKRDAAGWPFGNPPPIER